MNIRAEFNETDFGKKIIKYKSPHKSDKKKSRSQQYWTKKERWNG